MSDVTHYDGREEHHHDCALARLREAREQIANMDAFRDHIATPNSLQKLAMAQARIRELEEQVARMRETVNAWQPVVEAARCAAADMQNGWLQVCEAVAVLDAPKGKRRQRRLDAAGGAK